MIYCPKCGKKFVAMVTVRKGIEIWSCKECNFNAPKSWWELIEVALQWSREI